MEHHHNSTEKTPTTPPVRRSSRLAALNKPVKTELHHTSSNHITKPALSQKQKKEKKSAQPPPSTPSVVKNEGVIGSHISTEDVEGEQVSIQINSSPEPLPPPPEPLPPPGRKKNRRAPLKKPSSSYLTDEQRDHYMKVCVPLHNAALRGDWEVAEKILKDHPQMINMSITMREDTILHIVSSTTHTTFAEKLVNKMQPEDLELQNNYGATALWLAVPSTVKMVEVLLRRNSGLLKIRTKGDLPLMCALWSGNKVVAEYIYSWTNMDDEKWNQSDHKRMLTSSIALGLFDIALGIFNHSKEKGILSTDTDVLRYLAYKPSAFEGTMPSVVRRLTNAILPGRKLEPIDKSKGVEIVSAIWGEIVKHNNHEYILKLIAGDSTKKKKVEGKQIAGDSTETKKVEGKQSAGDSTEKKKVVGKQSAGDSTEKKKVEGKQIADDSTKKKKVEGKQIAGDSTGKQSAGDSTEKKKVEEKQTAGDSTEKKKVEGLLFTAARLGNHKFIMELLKLYPDIAWNLNEKRHTIFHIAVIYRHEKVYNLLYELGSRKLGTKDDKGNNILHLAAIKPEQGRLNIVSGAALQMQRELLWFQEVKNRVNKIDRRKLNNDGKTPQELFSKEHADLMERGERWMKDTAAQCMVVAALIATIMFAAAITLPGGNNSDNGHPIFMKRSAFIVFAVTDAISLCSSSTSILVFLAILTSRYTENDFLVSLPLKLMVGLLTLFISIATMMIAFGATFFLLYGKFMTWIPILITILAGLPVILFALLQYQLVFDVFNSTYNSRYMFKHTKHMLN